MESEIILSSGEKVTVFHKLGRIELGYLLQDHLYVKTTRSVVELGVTEHIGYDRDGGEGYFDSLRYCDY